MVGGVHAAAQLAQAGTSAILHLRSFNPLLASIVQAQAAGWAVPYAARQDGPGLVGGTASGSTAQQAASGVSAFAFQGTNAHAVLLRAGCLPASMQAVSHTWQRRRFWFAPPPHALASRVVAASQSAVELQVVLHAPALAHLWDHQVQGRALLPGAAMFEAAVAAGTLLLGSAEPTPAASAGLVLAGVSIPAPCVLPDSGSGLSSSAVLTTAVEQATGRVALHGFTAAHLVGCFARSAGAPAPAAISSSHLATGLRLLLAGSLQLEAAPRHPLPAAVAWVEDGGRLQAGQYLLHPAAIDNATQASGERLERPPGGLNGDGY